MMKAKISKRKRTNQMEIKTKSRKSLINSEKLSPKNIPSLQAKRK
jgi:hypothetical protein